MKTKLAYTDSLANPYSTAFLEAKFDIEFALGNSGSLSREALGYVLNYDVTAFTKDSQSKRRRDTTEDVANAIVEYTGTAKIHDMQQFADQLIEATNRAAESSSLLDSAIYLIPPETVNPTIPNTGTC